VKIHEFSKGNRFISPIKSKQPIIIKIEPVRIIRILIPIRIGFLFNKIEFSNHLLGNLHNRFNLKMNRFTKKYLESIKKNRFESEENSNLGNRFNFKFNRLLSFFCGKHWENSGFQIFQIFRNFKSFLFNLLRSKPKIPANSRKPIRIQKPHHKIFNKKTAKTLIFFYLIPDSGKLWQSPVPVPVHHK
jgi:hypothetical protein